LQSIVLQICFANEIGGFAVHLVLNKQED